MKWDSTPDLPNRTGTRRLLACAAGFAFLWTVARACVQSVTIDEADTFLVWVAPAHPAYWAAGSNNHVLHSLLMRAFIGVFGVSHLSLRAPALIGAAIYIGSAYVLCVKFAVRAGLALPLFVCLVFNPFVLDYLAAARGYSLALGFTMAMAVVLFRQWSRKIGARRACAAGSLFLGLGFSANFSFGLVVFVALLFILILAWRQVERPGPRVVTWRNKLSLIAWAVLLGLGVIVLLCASILADWRHLDLTYGASSLGETFASVLEASFCDLNPFLVNPVMLPAIEALPRAAAVLTAVLCLFRLALVCRDRTTLPRGAIFLPFAGCVAAVAAFSLVLHWILFRWFHLLLPKGRTALYLAPLLTLAAGSIAAVRLPNRAGRISRLLLNAALAALAACFLLSLRLTYFKEWKYGADTQRIYEVLSHYGHRFPVHEIPVNWRYSSSLNFYRIRSGRESFHEFTGYSGSYPVHRSLYVLYFPEDEGFIREQGLTVVYRGEQSEAVVAVGVNDAGPEPGR